MSDEQEPEQPPSAEECRRANEQCGGAPRYFTYPAPLPLTDEEQQRYDEIAARLNVPKRKGRRR
ncbi:MAG TPA: hypothetical protein VF175_03705 [Lacipirellula sp.]